MRGKNKNVYEDGLAPARGMRQKGLLAARAKHLYVEATGKHFVIDGNVTKRWRPGHRGRTPNRPAVIHSSWRANTT